jgi:hypothetical protein
MGNYIDNYMYTSNICNYESSSRTGLCNHKKTKKHIINKENYEKK